MEEKKPGMNEDWLSLWIGLLIFFLSLGALAKVDILGWGANNKVWTELSKSTEAVSKEYKPVKGEITKIEGQKVTLKKADGKEEVITVRDTAGVKAGDMYEKKGVSPLFSVFLTYLFLIVLMGIAAAALRVNVVRFAAGFTVVFWIAYACWLIGHYAYIAALDPAKEKIPWSLRLSGEAGFIIALVAGLILGNFFPGFSEKIKDVLRPELYVKTAIVIMGGALGVKAASRSHSLGQSSSWDSARS
jgi:hypothetical protein